MAGRIEDDFMSAEYDGRLIATARYCDGAVDDGRGVWAVSGLPGRLFTRNQAITAMVLAERRRAGQCVARAGAGWLVRAADDAGNKS